MCRYELPCLYERIHSVMQERQLSAPLAMEIVARAIADDPAESQRWIRGMGKTFVELAEAQVWAKGGSHKLPFRCNGDVPVAAQEVTTTSAATPAQAVGVSWRERVNPLDLWMPVGESGKRKRLGDFSRADVVYMQSYYTAAGRRLVDEGRKWGAVAAQMTDRERLEDAIGRIAQRAPDDCPKKLLGVGKFLTESADQKAIA